MPPTRSYRFTMRTFLAISSISLLFACAPQPASLQLASTEALSLHENKPVALPEVAVLDAKGAELASPPAEPLTWKVEPETVGKIEANNFVPGDNGEGTLTVSLGTLTASVPVKVEIPDTITFDTTDTSWTVGQSRPVVATVTGDGKPVGGLTLTWSSSNEQVAKVDSTGAVTGVAVGEAEISAAIGEVKASTKVFVAEATATAADPAAKAPGAM